MLKKINFPAGLGAGRPSLAAYGKSLQDGTALTEEDLQVLVPLLRDFSPGRWPAESGVAETTHAVVKALKEANRDSDLLAIVPEAWRIARDLDHEPLVIVLSDVIKEHGTAEEYGVVAALAGSGLAIANPILNAGQRQELDSALSAALSAAGPSLSVPKTDPRYPVLAAQKNWQIGRTQGAWTEYAAPGIPEMVQTMVGELNIDFLLWVANEHIRRDQYDQADALNKALITWMDSLEVPDAR